MTYSIIIPHKDCQKLLYRCISSIPVRNDIQIIVVDDNSKCREFDFIQFEPRHIELYLLQTSRTAGGARNEGLKHARGKWILFADADDYFAEKFLNILDQYLETDNDVIYFNADYRDGLTGERLKRLRFMSDFDNYDGSQTSFDTIRYHHNVPWTKMVSKRFIERYQLSFEETPNGNDILFSVLTGTLAKKIAVEKEIVYIYMRNDNSIITTKKQPVMSRLCRVKHVIQHNAFLRNVGHPEWQVAWWYQLSYEMRKSGFKDSIKILVAFIRNLYDIISTRNEWCEIVDTKKNMS